MVSVYIVVTDENYYPRIERWITREAAEARADELLESLKYNGEVVNVYVAEVLTVKQHFGKERK